MKTLFIETKANVEVKLPAKLVGKLPKKLCLAASVQFMDKLPKLKQQLEKSGRTVTLLKAKHSKYPGQLLGCGYMGMKFNVKTDAFLYIGDGLFHPEALLLGSDKDVYQFNPFTKEFGKLGREWVERIRKREKGALLTFLSSDSIGIIITLKPGQLGVQATLKQAFALQQEFPEKSFYYLVADTIDFQQLQNFTFVQCFVNTACPRMVDESEKFPKPVINIEKLMKVANNKHLNNKF